ncbi:MAG: hypothetical protein ACYC27_14660 [Armatimonadota bacterium]
MVLTDHTKRRDKFGFFQYVVDWVADALKVRIVDTAGTAIGAANPLPVEIDTSVSPIKVREDGINEDVVDTTVAWANSALINTEQTIDVALLAAPEKDGRYMITIINPSAVTAINVDICNLKTVGGVAKYPIVGSFQVLASESRSVIVDGFIKLEAGRISLKIATALGGGDGFTLPVIVSRL